MTTVHLVLEIKPLKNPSLRFTSMYVYNSAVKGKKKLFFLINPSNNIMRKEAEVFLNYCWIHGPSPLVGNSLTSRWSMTQSIGPPSLAQGTRIAVGFSTSISRFIPACGELSKPSWAIVQLDGSSPLTRGTHSCTRQKCCRGRFIPAYAGNSNQTQRF